MADPRELQEKTYRLLAGLRVNDCRFPPNASWCEWALANNCLPTDEVEKETENAELEEDEKVQIKEESVQPIMNETNEDAPREGDANAVDGINDVCRMVLQTSRVAEGIRAEEHSSFINGKEDKSFT